MKIVNGLLAGSLIAVSLMGMNNAASAQEVEMAYRNAALMQQAQGVQVSGTDGLQKYYKEDHDCEFDHDEYGDYHDDPRYDRGEYDDDCFED